MDPEDPQLHKGLQQAQLGSPWPLLIGAANPPMQRSMELFQNTKTKYFPLLK